MSESPDQEAVTREMKRVQRVFQRLTSEQRTNCAASHRLGPKQRRAVGRYFYTHPDLPGRGFDSRRQAAVAAVRAADRPAR